METLTRKEALSLLTDYTRALNTAMNDAKDNEMVRGAILDRTDGLPPFSLIPGHLDCRILYRRDTLRLQRKKIVGWYKFIESIEFSKKDEITLDFLN